MAEPMQLVRVATIVTMCFLLFHRISSALPPTPPGTLCVIHERDALLDFKAGLTYPGDFLPSWQGVECCRWTGVVCSNRTGHVVTLQVNSDWEIGGEIRSSLLTLRHLKQLDLSFNDFGGKPIPELIGGPGHLTHLKLSNSNFGGRIPPHLGNLSNLVSLRLGYMGQGSFYSPDLAWVSRLSKLQVLTIPEVNLSAASDWFHAISTLPYLTDLDLSFCGLQNFVPPPVRSNLTLRHLKQLDLADNNFGGNMVPELIGALGHGRLMHLDLSYSNFGGRIPPHLGNLSNLVSLQLESMPPGSYSPDLAWVSRLTKLQVLVITDVNLSAAVDWFHAINMLPYLIDLDLSSCGLQIAMPPPVHSNLTSLETLNLASNSFNTSLGAKSFVWNLPSLQELSLTDCRIDGQIPDAVGNLTSIQKMNLGSSSFTGMVPLAFKKLKKLQKLKLNSNFINMDVAELLHRLPSDELQELYLEDNYLTGSLPTRLGHFSSLTEICLDDNKLSGEIPVVIRELTNLRKLSLASNNLHGTITEDHFTDLTTLEELDISDNSLTVKVDNTWKTPFSLFSARFRSCILGPQFPAWLNQPRITYLDVSNTSIHDNIPVWITNSSAKFLNLSRNQLVGMLPMFSQESSLEILDVSSNQIVGPITTLPDILLLDLSRNNLSGALPSDILAPMLEVLLLFNNSFSGTIPCSLLQLQQLVFLDLSKNLLNETLPNCPIDFKTSQITMLKLNNNRLSGAFPLFLQKCRELQFLDLAYNKFSGSLPTWIGSKLPKLALMRLRSNMFSGAIPGQLTRMKGLQFLDVACNNISGNIPRSIGNLIAMTFTSNTSGDLFKIVHFGFELMDTTIDAYTNSLFVDIKGQQLEYTKGIAYMVNLDFSCNSLTGQIPQEIGMLIALKNLNLSWNSLTGIISQSIGQLQALESFDLSHNELSGEIPTSLSALTSLSCLNLSYNNLTGTIPSGNQLRTLEDPSSIYIGNPGLCGPPLPRSCPRTDIIPYAPEDHHEGMSDVVSLYLSMCIGFVLGLWVVFCGFLFKRKWRVGWFSFMDHMYDRAYVHVAMGWASLASKIRQG